MEVERESFQRWICAHELTHVFQFQGVPWLRGHLGELIRSYLDTVEVRVDADAAGGLPWLPRPAELVERFRQGGLAALVQTREQRGLMDAMQAAMAVIEGYAEHVMDALAAEAIPEHERLREAMDRRRAQPLGARADAGAPAGPGHEAAPVRAGQALLRRGGGRGGIEALNRVWRAPEMLPSLTSSSTPRAWLDRTGPGPRRGRRLTTGVSNSSDRASCNALVPSEVYVQVFVL